MIKNAQTEKNINEILKAAKENDEEMYRKGTIAVADISNTDITTDIKRNSRIKYHTFIEISGLDENTATIRFQKGLDLIHKFQEINLECSLVPHAPYSIGLKLWELFKEYYNKNNAIISIHNQESRQENNLFENGESKLLEVFQNNNLPVDNLVITGQTSVQSIIKFLLDSKILFVHNTFIKNSDIDIIKKLNRNKCGFVICPSSNLFIENKMPPVEMLYESGTPVMIGTDSLASGSSMSVFDEIKLIQNKTNIRFETILKSATLNAAEFMNWNNLGSFERGKKPGINLIQNFDFEKMKLKDDSRIKKII